MAARVNAEEGQDDEEGCNARGDGLFRRAENQCNEVLCKGERVHSQGHLDDGVDDAIVTGPAFTNGDTELSIQAASHSDTAGDEDFEQHTLKK